jgi:hypothetical protein
MTLTSNRGYFETKLFYLGWNNHPTLPVNKNDCGDETFGISIGRFYIGCYNGSGWCAGILDDGGFLPD